MTDNKKPSINLNGAEIKRLAEYALRPLEPFEVRDIVARMQETINRLESDKEALISGQETLQKALAEKNAEIEKLKNDCFGLSIQCIAMKDCIVTVAEEAVQEFAERLCEGRLLNDPVVTAVKVELKEMAGESK